MERRMPRSQAVRDQVAAVFAEADVARSYAARPPYAPELIEHLLAQVPGRARALDIGCGPGTIAIALADHFAEVIALDPSAPMLEVGRAADGGRHPNLVWLQARAEDLECEGGFDLVTAGTSIHWPDHARLFPKLAAWTEHLAVIVNAELAVPCGEAQATEFLKRWLDVMAARTPELRGRYDPAGLAAETRRHEAWIDIAERRSFAHRIRQSVETYIEAQHSTATFCRAAMGEDLTAAYDAELDALIRPYAQDGTVELAYVSTLTLGRPRTTPRA
jgi:SAM-dependent methyltransferase